MAGRALALVASVLLVASCTGPAPMGPSAPGTPSGPAPTGPSAPGTPSGSASASVSVGVGTVASFYEQRPTWTPCGAGRECATASVPLDYAQPGGATLGLPLTRWRATASPRLGTLFVNPGGPGASPTTLGDWFDRTGLEAYDLVMWDPRGVGGSSPVVCGDAATAAYLRLDFSPEDAAEAEALASGERSFAEACLAGSGRALLEHVTTVEDARDLDILRAVVGDEKLTFYGASYGTLLGAWYAELFPGRVGRIVLDSPVDVNGSTLGQGAAMDAGLRAFAGWCAAEAGCEWGSSEAVAYDALGSWLRALDAGGLAAGARRLSQSEAAVAVATFLYAGRAGWAPLRSALAAARAGDGSVLLAASDAVAGRRADGSFSTMVGAGAAIRCADLPPRPASETTAAWKRDTEGSLFGFLLGPDTLCASWPVRAASWVTPRGVGAAPVLVVGATGDPGTPFAWAEATATTLASARRLLTYDGYGHVSYGRAGECVNTAVRGYLMSGVLPEAGKVCR